MDRTAPRKAIDPALATLTATMYPTFARFVQLAAVYLFGSVARGEAGAESDLDLGLVFRKRGETALDHHWMLCDLASRLEASAGGRALDLVVLESQGFLFRHRVLLDGILIYEADRARRVDFESETFSRAFDFRPTYELATRGRLAAILRQLARSPSR